MAVLIEGVLIMVGGLNTKIQRGLIMVGGGGGWHNEEKYYY